LINVSDTKTLSNDIVLCFFSGRRFVKSIMVEAEEERSQTSLLVQDFRNEKRAGLHHMNYWYSPKPSPKFQNRTDQVISHGSTHGVSRTRIPESTSSEDIPQRSVMIGDYEKVWELKEKPASVINVSEARLKNPLYEDEDDGPIPKSVLSLGHHISVKTLPPLLDVVANHHPMPLGLAEYQNSQAGALDVKNLDPAPAKHELPDVEPPSDGDYSYGNRAYVPQPISRPPDAYQPPLGTPSPPPPGGTCQPPLGTQSPPPPGGTYQPPLGTQSPPPPPPPGGTCQPALETLPPPPQKLAWDSDIAGERLPEPDYGDHKYGFERHHDIDPTLHGPGELLSVGISEPLLELPSVDISEPLPETSGPGELLSVDISEPLPETGDSAQRGPGELPSVDIGEPLPETGDSAQRGPGEFPSVDISEPLPETDDLDQRGPGEFPWLWSTSQLHCSTTTSRIGPPSSTISK
jgi:hypothetical protein